VHDSEAFALFGWRVGLRPMATPIGGLDLRPRPTVAEVNGGRADSTFDVSAIELPHRPICKCGTSFPLVAQQQSLLRGAISIKAHVADEDLALFDEFAHDGAEAFFAELVKQ